MKRTVCPQGMVDTCCENYDSCDLNYDKDAEIKRLNEKIEFLARANMLYSDWEHRETQVTSGLIRKGIEEHKINVELRAEIERLKQRPWVEMTDEEIDAVCAPLGFAQLSPREVARAVLAKSKEKNT